MDNHCEGDGSEGNAHARSTVKHDGLLSCSHAPAAAAAAGVYMHGHSFGLVSYSHATTREEQQREQQQSNSKTLPAAACHASAGKEADLHAPLLLMQTGLSDRATADGCTHGGCGHGGQGCFKPVPCQQLPRNDPQRVGVRSLAPPHIHNLLNPPSSCL